MTRWLTRLMFLILIVTTIGCDRVTKHVAVSTLAGTPRQSFLKDTIRLEYAENTGAFLSLGADWPPEIRMWVFTLWSGVILAGAVVLAIRRRWTGRPLMGLSLLFAGGASNLVDRVTRGSVVDFMNVGLGPVRTGIFNVADVAILLGLAVLLFTAMGHTKDRTDERCAMQE